MFLYGDVLFVCGNGGLGNGVALMEEVGAEAVVEPTEELPEENEGEEKNIGKLLPPSEGSAGLLLA